MSEENRRRFHARIVFLVKAIMIACQLLSPALLRESEVTEIRHASNVCCQQPLYAAPTDDKPTERRTGPRNMHLDRVSRETLHRIASAACGVSQLM
ncbi:hypothetical protein [Brevibacterium renqingii]|uniref:hypothetical protein n=1 Tax=Brevibacterium renqingii TaxID=2776916 RepID=UPI001ADF45F6|nr:hypothetical protein [Brevibacterium renqingii]